MLSQLLFESPWPLVLAFVIAALMLVFAAQRSEGAGRGMRWAALVCLVLAVGVWCLAKVVTTDREHLIAQTQRLVSVTAPLDLEALSDLLDSGAELVSSNGQLCMDRQRLLSVLKSLLDSYGVASHDVRTLGARMKNAGAGESWVALRTKLKNPDLIKGLDQMGGDVPSRWELTWRRSDSDDQWRITRLRCTKVMQIRPDCGVLGG